MRDMNLKKLGKKLKLASILAPVLAVLLIFSVPSYSKAAEPTKDNTNVYANGDPVIITSSGIYRDLNIIGVYEPDKDTLISTLENIANVYAGYNGANCTSGTITVDTTFTANTPRICAGGANGTVDSTRIDIKNSTSEGLTIDQDRCTGMLITTGSTGTVNGTFTIPSDKTLEINSGTTITIPTGANLVNDGTLRILSGGMLINNGILKNNSTYNSAGVVKGSGTVIGSRAYDVTITMTDRPYYPSSIADLEYNSVLTAGPTVSSTARTQLGTWGYVDSNGNAVTPGTSIVGANGATYYIYTLKIKAMPSNVLNNTAGYNFDEGLVINAGNPQVLLEDSNATMKVMYTVKIKERSIRSTSIVLSPTRFVFNGNSQVPAIVVKDGGSVLSEDTHYTVAWPADTTTVGPHTVSITGMGMYADTVEKTYDIVSTPLTLEATLDISTKTYDGLSDASDMVNVVVRTSEGTPIDPLLYTYTAQFQDANAGTGKAVVVTVTLNDGATNYAFANGSRTANTVVTGFTIQKAAWPAGYPADTTFEVYQSVEHDYSVSGLDALFRPTFPVDKTAMNAGTMTFSVNAYDKTGAVTKGNVFKSAPALHASVNSTLLLAIDEFNAPTSSQVAYVRLNIISQNLADTTATVKLICKDRNATTCAVMPTIGELIFGQKLTDLAYPTGGRYESLNNNDVQGTYSWVGWRNAPEEEYKNSGVPFPAQGSYLAGFKYTPNAIEFAPCYVDLTLKVNPKPVTHGDMKLTLSPLTYKYDGTEHTPTVTAYDGAVKLTENVDYVVTYQNNKNAGTASAIVNGKGNYSDESTKVLPFTITKLPITLASAKVNGKVYDGTVVASASNAVISGLNGSETLEQNVDYKLTANFSAADVGQYTAIPVTLSLMNTEKANNYSVAPSGASYTFGGTAEITKATIMPLDGTTNVVNCFAAVYEYDLSQLLPALTGTKSYGEVTYEYVTHSDPSEILRTVPEITSGGKHLKLNVKLIPEETEVPNAANATVRLASRNYNFVNALNSDTAVVNINIVDRPVPQGTPTANGSLMFGQELRTLELAGTMSWNGVNVPGAFSWKYPHTVPAIEGEYRGEWVFTPESQAFHIAEGTIIVNVTTKHIDLRIVFDDVAQVYDGQPKTPKFTLRYNGAPLDLTNKNNEYFVTYEYSDNIYAGNGKLTASVTGIYTGSASAEFEILPQELVIGGLVKAHDKKFDGTTVADVDQFYLEGVVTGDVLEWGRDYAVTAAFADPNVGVDKTVSVNIVLSDTGVATNYKMLHSTTTTTADIYQDNTHSGDLGWMFVENNKAYTYEYDLADLLPAGRKLGSFVFEIYEVKDPTGIVFDTANPPTIIKGTAKLKIPVKNIERTDELTNIASIRISINSQNYQPIKTSVYLSTTNRNVPEGEAFQTDVLAYGQTLNDLPIDGAMYAAGTKKQIPGRFVWNDSSIMPPVGEYRAGWTFTPLDSINYAPVKGATLVEIEKAIPSGTPDYTEISEPDTRLREAYLDGLFENLNNGTVVSGSVDWIIPSGPTKGNVLSPATIVQPDTPYTWQFMPSDTNSYETRTGEIIIYSTLPDPTPTPEPTPTPTPGPTTGPTPTLIPGPTTDPGPTYGPIPSVSPSTNPTTIPTTIPTTNPTTNPTVAPVTAASVNSAIDGLPTADETKTTDQGGLAKNASMSATDYQKVLQNVVNNALSIENNYLDLPATDKSNVTEDRLKKLQNVYYVASKLLEPSKLKLLDAKSGVTLTTDPVTGVPSLSVTTLPVSDANYMEGKAKAPSKTAVAGYDVQLMADGKAIKPTAATEVSFIFRTLKNKQLDIWHKNTSGNGEWESYSPTSNADGRAAVDVKTLSPFVILTSSSNVSGGGGGGSRPPQTGDATSAIGFVMIALAMAAVAIRRKRA